MNKRHEHFHEMRRMRRNGMTLAEIGDAFGVTPVAVIHVLGRSGYPKRRAALDIVEAAVRFGIGFKGVRSILDGVSSRTVYNYWKSVTEGA